MTFTALDQSARIYSEIKLCCLKLVKALSQRYKQTKHEDCFRKIFKMTFSNQPDTHIVLLEGPQVLTSATSELAEVFMDNVFSGKNLPVQYFDEVCKNSVNEQFHRKNGIEKFSAGARLGWTLNWPRWNDSIC